jgi:hypothetical protein
LSVTLEHPAGEKRLKTSGKQRRQEKRGLTRANGTGR